MPVDLEPGEIPWARLLFAGSAALAGCLVAVSWVWWWLLRRSHRREAAANALVQASFDAWVELDRSLATPLARLNPRFCDAVGCCPGKASLLDLVHSDDLEQLQNLLKSLRAGNHVASKIRVQLRSGAGAGDICPNSDSEPLKIYQEARRKPVYVDAELCFVLLGKCSMRVGLQLLKDQAASIAVPDVNCSARIPSCWAMKRQVTGNSTQAPDMCFTAPVPEADALKASDTITWASLAEVQDIGVCSEDIGVCSDAGSQRLVILNEDEVTAGISKTPSEDSAKQSFHSAQATPHVGAGNHITGHFSKGKLDMFRTKLQRLASSDNSITNSLVSAVEAKRASYAQKKEGADDPLGDMNDFTV